MTDVLSKRLFFGGCLGLPWLWTVHGLHWLGEQRGLHGESTEDTPEPEPNESSLLNETGRGDENGGTNAGGPDNETSHVNMATRKWVFRGFLGTFIVCGLWVSWIVVFQLNRNRFVPNWFVRSEDEAESTGW